MGDSSQAQHRGNTATALPTGGFPRRDHCIGLHIYSLDWYQQSFLHSIQQYYIYRQRHEPDLCPKNVTQHRYLALEHLTAWSTNRLPPLHTCLEIEYLMDILFEFCVQGLVILQGQLIKLAFSRLC
jgi:hypothetical protein